MKTPLHMERGIRCLTMQSRDNNVIPTGLEFQEG